MSTFIWACVIGSIVLIIGAAPSVQRRHPGPSWFDLLPHLTQSQKQKTRTQQTRRHGKRRY